MTGIFLIAKPTGITSFGVVHALRKILAEPRIGHAGTLDPMASGLMLVAVGRLYTRQLDKFLKLDKRYLATIRLGATSTTLDATGELTPVSSTQPSDTEVQKGVEALVKTYAQMPPDFSAKKIGGVRAYTLARKGQAVNLQPKTVTVFAATLVDYTYPDITVDFSVSSGTYIRTLAGELGEALETGAHLAGLIRTEIGSYHLDRAIALDDIKSPQDLAEFKIS